jgi:hypothetical protein
MAFVAKMIGGNFFHIPKTPVHKNSCLKFISITESVTWNTEKLQT